MRQVFIVEVINGKEYNNTTDFCTMTKSQGWWCNTKTAVVTNIIINMQHAPQQANFYVWEVNYFYERALSICHSWAFTLTAHILQVNKHNMYLYSFTVTTDENILL